MYTNTAHERLTLFLSETLHNILKLEEILMDKITGDVSYKEMYSLKAVERMMKDGIPAAASKIAAALRVTPGTFTASADMLVKKGYLVRKRDENDQRSIRVYLTDKGRAAVGQCMEFHKKTAAEILKKMTNNDVEALVEATKKLEEIYTEKETLLKGSKVKIYADSSCDLSPEEAKKHNVTIIPMNITFGDEVYRQDIDFTTDGFYQMLSSSKTMPMTTQLTPFELEEAYKEATKDGSEVVAIHLSSALSGTYQSAYIASCQVPGVYPVDSKNATMGSGLLVRIAIKMRDEGKSAKEIAKKLEELREKVMLIAYIPSLKYLVRGGRVSAAAGFVGGVMNIYPILTVKDGAVKSMDKARGKSAACKKIEKAIKKHGIDKQYGVVFAHAAATEDMEDFKNHLKSLTEGCEKIVNSTIGAVIGTHTGPGAVGLAFIANESH